MISEKWNNKKISYFDSLLNEMQKNVYSFFNYKQIRKKLEILDIPYSLTKAAKDRYWIYIGEKKLKNKFPIKRIPLVTTSYYGIWGAHLVLGIMVYLELVKKPTFLLALDAGSNNVFTRCYKIWKDSLSQE